MVPATARHLIPLILLIAGGFLLATAPLPMAGVSVAGTTFVLALLVRPAIGLWALPFAVPLGSLRKLPVAGFDVGATEFLIGLTLLAWVGRGIAHRRLQLEAPPLLVPLLLLLGAMLLSATGMYAVSATVKELVKWGEILVVYVLAFNMIDDRRVGLVLAGALLLAGSLSALQGLAGALLHVGPPQFAILGGRLYRAFGTFGQPNPFGGYMNHSLPVAVSLLSAMLIERPHTLQIRNCKLEIAISNLQFLICNLALLGITGLLAAGLALSWSRGAWLGAVAGLGTVGLAWMLAILDDNEGPSRAYCRGSCVYDSSAREGPSEASVPGAQALRWRTVALLWVGTAVAIFFVLLGGFGFLPQPIAARIDSAVATFTTLDARGANITDANFATLERVAHWQAAWDMWRDHFWTGIGIGNYEAAYPDYRLPKWPYALGHAHNIYFNMAAETGFIGLMAYLVFVVSAVGHCWRVARGAPEPAVRGLVIGVLGVLIALAIHNFFDNMYVHAMGVHLALTLGLVSALGRHAPSGLNFAAVP